MAKPKKPTSLRILDGDRPCRINGDEPKSPPGLGDPPAWLDAFGVEMWAMFRERLEPMRIATRADEVAVMVACRDYSTWRKALARIDAEGLTMTTDTTTKAHPCVAIVNQVERNLIRILGQFGMTPSSRAGLHVLDSAEDVGIMDYFEPVGRGNASGRRK